MSDNYLLLARHYSTKGMCVWWMPNGNGYTSDVDKAGRYSKKDADSRAYNEGPRGKITIAVPESALTEVPIVRVVSDEYAHCEFKRFELPPMFDAKGNRLPAAPAREEPAGGK